MRRSFHAMSSALCCRAPSGSTSSAAALTLVFGYIAPIKAEGPKGGKRGCKRTSLGQIVVQGKLSAAFKTDSGQAKTILRQAKQCSDLSQIQAPESVPCKLQILCSDLLSLSY